MVKEMFLMIIKTVKITKPWANHFIYYISVSLQLEKLQYIYKNQCFYNPFILKPVP